MSSDLPIETLAPVESNGPGGAPRPGGADHPMRVITRRIAIDREWTPDMQHEVRALFDQLAPEWDATRRTPERIACLDDAFDRTGYDSSAARCLELGAGTGIFTEAISARCDHTTSVDLSHSMLVQAPSDAGGLVLVDGSVLPFADDAFDAVLMVNMLLFPSEVDRVLAPAGTVVWVNTRGDQTPIHLPAADVAAALPGTWRGTTARAGTGFWAVLQRR